MIRVYPSYEWGRNFAGFHRDYDPRIRPWYVSSTSGPKNVMIILDCSSSMVGTRWQIAKAAAKTILNTLTQQDYVNVICTRDSYYSYYSHYRYRTSRTLGCLKSGLLPATTSVKRDLMEKIDEIEPDGRSLFIDGFRMAMNVFQFSQPPLKGSCQNVAIFLTDGLREDGNDVRCEPGYYTYSYSNGHTTRTYHPGKKCNEDWDEVWEEVAGRNPISGKARNYMGILIYFYCIFLGSLFRLFRRFWRLGQVSSESSRLRELRFVRRTLLPVQHVRKSDELLRFSRAKHESDVDGLDGTVRRRIRSRFTRHDRRTGFLV